MDEKIETMPHLSNKPVSTIDNRYLFFMSDDELLEYWDVK